jgi:hypothetical protein
MVHTSVTTDHSIHTSEDIIMGIIRFFITFRIHLFGLVLLLVSASVSAQDATSFLLGDTEVELTRGNVHGNVLTGVVTLTPESEGETVNVILGNRSITASRIYIYSTSDTVEASGDVILYDSGNLAFANHVVYDGSTETIRLTQARYSSPEFFLTGDTIDVADDGKLILHKGTLTTCDLWEPHYQIVSDKIVVKPGVRFWTYGTTYRVKNLPVGWLPYFTRSMSHRNYSTFVLPGHSSDMGAKLHTRFLYHHNSYIRPNMYADFLEELGVGLAISNRYRAPDDKGGYDSLHGRMYYYYIDQEDSDDDFSEEQRWKVAGNHWQRLPGNFLLTSRYQRLSDRDFNRDYEDEELAKGWTHRDLEEERNSFINLEKTEDLYSFRVFGKKRLDDFFLSSLPDTEQKPEVRLELKRDQLFESLPIYYHSWLDWGIFRRESGYGAEGEITRFIDECERGDFNLEFSMPFSLTRGLRIVPFINYRLTHYEDPRIRHLSRVQNPMDAAVFYDELVEYQFDNETRHLGRAGIEFKSRLAHNFETFLKKRYEKARFVLQPRVVIEGWDVGRDLNDVDYDATDKLVDADLSSEGIVFPTIDSTDFYREDAFRMGYRVDAKLQGKNGDSTRDILRLSVDGGYYAERNQENEHDDLIVEVFFSPRDTIAFTSFQQYDLNEDNMRASYQRLSFLQLPWLANTSIFIGYGDFDPLVGEGQRQISLDMTHLLSDKWTLNLNHRYDLDDDTSRKNRIRLTRDLHDWYWDINFKHENRLDRDDDYSFGMQLRFKSGPFANEENDKVANMVRRQAWEY